MTIPAHHDPALQPDQVYSSPARPPATGALAAPGRVRGEKQSPWSIFIRKPSTIIFGVILVFMVLVSVVGPMLVRDPKATDFPRLLPPSAEFLLGTDMLGRDYLARVVYGGRVSLLVGFVVAVLCLTIGLIVGGLAGYYGGIMDVFMVRVAEFFQVLPGLVLALVAAALFGASVWLIVLILAITMWPRAARIVRAEAMRISQLGYVESAKAAGFKGLRIIWSDVLPNSMPPVLVATTMTVGQAVLIESGLAYLGIGDANHPSWGALLNSAQGHMHDGWILAVAPGLCIFIVVLAINMLGDGLNDALNPTIGRVK